MEIIAYEMRFQKDIIEQSNISCVSFEEKYFSTYMHIYNECFFEMRKTLNIEPYNFLNDYEQIKEKSKDIYLLVENEKKKEPSPSPTHAAETSKNPKP